MPFAMPCIRPQHAPVGIEIFSTLNTDTSTVYGNANFALHVDDPPHHVLANRAALARALPEGYAIQWLQQTHSTKVAYVAQPQADIAADGGYTDNPKIALAVLTADCLPLVLVADTMVAVVHCGWRGLCGGIIGNALLPLLQQQAPIYAWIGPAICQTCYQVGDDCRDAFVQQQPALAQFFTNDTAQRYHADLVGIARFLLHQAGVAQIETADTCTRTTPTLYSYRRAQTTGRFATVVYRN